MNNSVIGLDIAKNIFHLCTFVEGKAVKKKLKRAELLIFFANYPVSLIGIEPGRVGTLFCLPMTTKIWAVKRVLDISYPQFKVSLTPSQEKYLKHYLRNSPPQHLYCWPEL